MSTPVPTARLRRSQCRRTGGFTLVEVMIAIAIFVIVAAMAMGGYSQLTKQSAIVDENTARVRAVQTTIQRMTQDFALIEPRAVREPLGDSVENALRADKRTADQVATLTRAGWTNPAGVPRSTLQRVTYRMEDKTLIREYWLVLDRTLTAEPVDTVMLDNVNNVGLRFMDGNRTWHQQWPPLGYSAPDISRLRPIAVEITLELEDWGKIVRLVEVSG
jgi:general secretion pathway protein J